MIKKPIKNVLELIGNTPIFQIKNIYAKIESLNPSGSIKDRVALQIIEDAEKKGELKPGYTIIEATSGNTGIALSMVAAVKGYKMIIVMPENMSKERQQMMKAFGAEIVLTSESGSLKEAIAKTEEIAKQQNTFLARQFENKNNIIAHEETTAKEIIEQVGKVDAIVAGVGTGGTLMGIANVMRKINPDVKIIAVEPTEAAVMFGGMRPSELRSHKIQGIGDGFIPKIVDMSQVDEVITVTSEEAMSMSKKLAKEYGLMVGISSGANIFASLKLSKRFEKIVTVLPDRGERYLSMGLYEWGGKNGSVV